MDTTHQPQSSTFFQRVSRALPIFAMILLSILLWLPFGLRIGFYADEWTVMADIQKGAFLTGSVRPFEVLAWVIAYHLSPIDLTVGINLLLMILIMGKGIIAYLLLSDMQFNKLFAFGTAALLVLYPADSGVFYMGALSIHLSILTYLLAVWFLVRFWLTGKRWLWMPIVLITGLCVGLYEGVYPLIFLAPLTLIYLQRGINRRVIVTSLLWFVTPFIFGLRLISILFLNNSANSYQSSLLASDHSVGTILSSLWRANRYSLGDSWISAALQTIAPSGWSGVRNLFKTAGENPFLIYGLVAALIIVVTSMALVRLQQNVTTSKKQVVLILLVSPLFLTFGFLLYSLTNLRDLHLRTLLHASIGAALFVSACLWLLGGLVRKQTLIYGIGLSLLAVVATSNLLFQHQGYVASGKFQVSFLQTLVRAAPQITPHSTLVVIDETPDHELETLFNRISLYLNSAIQIIYSDSTLTGVICYPNIPTEWGLYEEKCLFNPYNMQLILKDKPYWTHTYDQIVIFRYKADKTLQLESDITSYTSAEQAASLYAPDKIVDTHAPFPIRAQTMLHLGG